MNAIHIRVRLSNLEINILIFFDKFIGTQIYIFLTYIIMRQCR